MPLDELEPFLVLPGYGKAFDVRSNAAMWYKPESAFTTTHDIFIIGLSLAQDDHFIRNFFLSNLPDIECFSGVANRRIYVINPDRDAIERYATMIAKVPNRLINEPFSLDHLALMQSFADG